MGRDTGLGCIPIFRSRTLVTDFAHFVFAQFITQLANFVALSARRLSTRTGGIPAQAMVRYA